MINGNDVIIETVNPKKLTEEVIRLLTIDCPNIVKEVLDENEIFFYKDVKSKEIWDEIGASEENRNTMIHLISDKDAVTIVVDDLNENKKIIASAKKYAKELKGRLNFAVICINLAEDEIKKHGRLFMEENEDVYDSAVNYGGSIRLTKEEIIEAKEYLKKKKNENS